MTSIIQAMSDLARSLMGTVGLLFAGWVSIGDWDAHTFFAQAIPVVDAIPPSWQSAFEFVLRQGGAIAVVLLVVLWVVRRDYRSQVDDLKEQKVLLVGLIKESVSSNQELKASVDKSNDVSERMITSLEGVKDAVNRLAPDRRVQVKD